jgi:branched-chain amino acid transport system permease protein
MISMAVAAQTVANILVLSAIYILVAIGFSFLFNMLAVLNLAHGAIYMVGGYVGFYLINATGMNHWLAIVLAAIIMGLFGVVAERVAFRRFTGDFNSTVMVTIAVGVILSTFINVLAGTKVQNLPTLIEGVITFGPVSVSWQRIGIFLIGAALLGITVWFVHKTKSGKQMQAIAQDSEGAALQGIKIHRVSAIASFVGFAMAAVAGCLMGAYLTLGPYMGDTMMVKAIVLVIIAGAGSVGGIFITGLFLGALDGVLPVVLPGAWSDAIAMVVILVLLLLRPRGFFGHEL